MDKMDKMDEDEDEDEDVDEDEDEDDGDGDGGAKPPKTDRFPAMCVYIYIFDCKCVLKNVLRERERVAGSCQNDVFRHHAPVAYP